MLGMWTRLLGRALFGLHGFGGGAGEVSEISLLCSRIKGHSWCLEEQMAGTRCCDLGGAR